jgi:predicted nucleic acid-binding Zn ribbon protein
MRKLSNMLRHAEIRDEVLKAARAQTVLRDWIAIVGPGLAAKSHPDRYERGTVWVAVESSAWAQELRMGKETILARLRDRSGESGLFQDVRFGVRPIVREQIVPEADLGIEEAHKANLRGLSIREIAEKRLKNWSQE